MITTRAPDGANNTNGYTYIWTLVIDQMFLCLFLTLGLHQTAYVFLCFCVFFRKTQKHIDPFFFFFPTIRLHQRANVFLSFCVFFSEKHKNTLTKCFFVFFLTLWLHQTAYVFLCFCVFSEKHKNTLTQFCWK